MALQLFNPITVGPLQLSHRIVLAPLTRIKSTKTTHVPIISLMKEYYTQRASKPGTLLITEATFIAPRAGGYDNIPGIWSPEQIGAWKAITDSVHAKGSFIFLQLWALGRASNPSILASEHLPFVAPSPIPLKSKSKFSQSLDIPRELSISEIHEYTALYAQAAKNAVHEAGFDGVEIHAANGYLIDQFLQDVSNQRTDAYGSSVPNRSRFAEEVVTAVSEAVGEERTGIRISPWSTFQSMRMSDPIPQFSHFVSAIKDMHPSLAYLHVVEPQMAGSTQLETFSGSNDFLRAIWKPKPYISAGGFTRDTAIARSESDGDIIAFGRDYISNPDLPTRIEYDIPLTPYNSKTFYTPGDQEGAEVGYIDYPFAQKVGGQLQGRL